MRPEILVPLDGSSLAEGALPHVLALARATSCGIALLRVIPPLYITQPMLAAIVPSEAVIEVWQEEPKRARDYLERIATQLKGQGCAVRSAVVEGDPAVRIIEAAEENAGVTMIAMSTHGRGGLDRWLFGSVAEKVLQAAPRPLLLVRSQEPREGEAAAGSRGGWIDRDIRYQQVLVPLDGSAFADQGLAVARALAGPLHARLILAAVVESVHAWLPPEEATLPLWAENAEQAEAGQLDVYLRRTADQLAAAGLTVETQRAAGDPAEEILRASHASADLIVRATHGRSGLQRLWLGSVAVKVVRGATIPVLLVRVRQPAAGFPPEHGTVQAAIPL